MPPCCVRDTLCPTTKLQRPRPFAERTLHGCLQAGIHHMHLESHIKHLAERHIERSLNELEHQVIQGRYNWGCLQSVAAAARLLSREDVVARAAHLLQQAPDASFWAGAITNLDTAQPLSPRLRTVPPLVELETEFPPYQENQIF